MKETEVGEHRVGRTPDVVKGGHSSDLLLTVLSLHVHMKCSTLAEYYIIF